MFRAEDYQHLQVKRAHKAAGHRAAYEGDAFAHLTDKEMLKECLAAMKGEYNEIDCMSMVESLERRVHKVAYLLNSK